MSKIYEILIVDDVKENLQLLSEFLTAADYVIRSATSGKIALMSLSVKLPDLILLDIKMPDMNGFEVCEKLKSNPETAKIPIIFISAADDVQSKVDAFRYGGIDYITKPFANEEVLARVSTHLQLDEYKHHLEDKVEDALQEIRILNKELTATQDEVVMKMGAITEERSEETGMHVVRVGEFSYLLAKLYQLDEKTCELIYKAAPMHDIGKVGIPDSILHKKGSLEDDEWKVMKTHTTKGYEIFKSSTRELLKMVAIIANEHHEKWDGTGYPQGLKGKDIHIAGRIVILADVFDALTSERCYKKAWTIEKAVEFLKEQSGIMFEPKIMTLFLDNLDKFIALKNKLKD